MVNEKANKIREMLNNGDSVTLICVNKEEFAPVHRSYNEEVLRSGELEVSSVTESGNVVLKNGLTITKTELRFFEIKECVTTFNELVDVAIQAWRDGLVEEVVLDDFISVSTKERTYHITTDSDGGASIKGVIDYIDSLYDESFVIERRGDLERLRANARLALSNKEEIVFSNKFMDSFFFDIDDLNTVTLPFIVLKGATVTQRRING